MKQTLIANVLFETIDDLVAAFRPGVAKSMVIAPTRDSCSIMNSLACTLLPFLFASIGSTAPYIPHLHRASSP